MKHLSSSTHSPHRVSKHPRQPNEKPPSTPAVPNAPVACSQALWNGLPLELTQKIVWCQAPLPGPHRHRVPQDTRLALSRLALVDRKLNRATQPFLRLARWADEFARYWPESHHASPPPDIETLLVDPMACGGPPDLMLALPDEPEARARVNLLLKRLNAYSPPPPSLALLLTRMFRIWLDRRQDAEAHATRLPTDGLPQLLLHADPLMTPLCVFDTLGTDASNLSLRSVDCVPLSLLMQHFPSLDDDFKPLLALHWFLLLEDDDLQLTEPTRAALERHGIHQDSAVQLALRWKSGLLDAPPERVDLELGRACLAFLQGTQAAAGLASMILLARFCTVPRLRALAGDATWIALIQRAMTGIHYQSPAVWADIQRADYLVAALPRDLGVAAFKGLTAAQRLRFIRRPHCGVYFKARIYMAYVKALVEAEDVSLRERLATLNSFAEGIRQYGGLDKSALPQLDAWRIALAKAIGLGEPAQAQQDPTSV